MKFIIWLLRWLLEITVIISCILAMCGIIEWSYNILIPVAIDFGLWLFVKFIDWCNGY